MIRWITFGFAPAPPPLPRGWSASESTQDLDRPSSPEGPGGPLPLENPASGLYESAMRGW
jgi:hypothetical protein